MTTTSSGISGSGVPRVRLSMGSHGARWSGSISGYGVFVMLAS